MARERPIGSIRLERRQFVAVTRGYFLRSGRRVVGDVRKRHDAGSAPIGTVREPRRARLSGCDRLGVYGHRQRLRRASDGRTKPADLQEEARCIRSKLLRRSRAVDGPSCAQESGYGPCFEIGLYCPYRLYRPLAYLAQEPVETATA